MKSLRVKQCGFSALWEHNYKITRYQELLRVIGEAQAVFPQLRRNFSLEPREEPGKITLYNLRLGQNCGLTGKSPNMYSGSV